MDSIKYTERDANIKDIGYIFKNLREDDLNECLVGDDCAERVLVESYKLSTECYVMCADGVPFAVYGVVRDPYDEGIVWMMGTDEIRTHKVHFMRAIRGVIDGWLEFYHRLYNIVWNKNTLHIKWLAHMGFQLGPLLMHRGHEFRSFELCAQ